MENVCLIDTNYVGVIIMFYNTITIIIVLLSYIIVYS